MAYLTRSLALICALILIQFFAAAQSPFKPQLAVPVHLNGLAQASTSSPRQPTKTYLSGIALMFLDTANTADELLVTGSSDLIIWHDCIGRSTKVTFIVPDTQFIGKLELMYFGSKCTADLLLQDRNTSATFHSAGELLLNAQDSYQLVFDQKSEKLPYDIFHPLNVQLMQLHARDQRKVTLKSWFNKDSINVIVGADSQFDTDFDLFWLDQSLRNRLHALASNNYSKLYLFDQQNSTVLDSSLSKNKTVLNRAERTPYGLKGSLTITMTPDGSARYVFLKPFRSYTMFIDYAFHFVKGGTGQVSIQRFGLRDLNTGDFVEMDLYDLVNNGMPVMYVDLLKGVITSLDGTWDITNVIHAIEDVVAASALPGE
ncbi:MAG: hypothetical protein MUC59_07610 [Saprospiraceae bacterium]|nr:hypothetical protein [Saprospiraceae bacterium]